MKRPWLFVTHPKLSDFYARANCVDPDFDEDTNKRQPTAEHLDWLHPRHRVGEPLNV